MTCATVNIIGFSKQIAAVLVAITCSILAAEADERPTEIFLSKIWTSSATGFIISAPQTAMLVIDAHPDNKPYLLSGNRLVIRAANVQLRDKVIIESWGSEDGPDQVPGWDVAAGKGPDGPEGDPGKGGQNGEEGSGGANGDIGRPGFASGPITLNIGVIEGSGNLLVRGVGSRGGMGQDGQQGGKGGTAGHGGKAKQGVDCISSGGNAGLPGPGGKGGVGGRGGMGGKGSNIRISRAVAAIAVPIGDAGSIPEPEPGRIVIVFSGGAGGKPGSGGNGGDGGEGNEGGSGSATCGGGHGSGKALPRPKTEENLGFGDVGQPGAVSIIP